eukprot:Mycagemm_TRINITY_DN10287_c1_g1::TRINITY_DN10287_c1_g1_i1::g.3690::m.3690 type:complete len:325 gc:universal TRINITY_DN10287_c1_g1_i1:1098-124(-)
MNASQGFTTRHASSAIVSTPFTTSSLFCASACPRRLGLLSKSATSLVHEPWNAVASVTTPCRSSSSLHSYSAHATSSIWLPNARTHSSAHSMQSMSAGLCVSGAKSFSRLVQMLQPAFMSCSTGIASARAAGVRPSMEPMSSSSVLPPDEASIASCSSRAASFIVQVTRSTSFDTAFLLSSVMAFMLLQADHTTPSTGAHFTDVVPRMISSTRCTVLLTTSAKVAVTTRSKDVLLVRHNRSCACINVIKWRSMPSRRGKMVGTSVGSVPLSKRATFVASIDIASATCDSCAAVTICKRSAGEPLQQQPHVLLRSFWLHCARCGL